jgi:hypothetical protein
MSGRSAQCLDVLRRYGLEESSFAVIGADRRPGEGLWCVMVTGDRHFEYLDVDAAADLAFDLQRIDEVQLAQRLSRAIETAKRQMRP